MARYRSGEIRIGVSELLGEVDDDDLLDELAARKLTPAGPGETVDLDIVREAYDAIQRGAAIEAKCILDRLLFPKWKTADRCMSQYKGFFKQ